MREYLKALREDIGISQQGMADAIGITRQYYQQIENGERQTRMDITLAVKIADALNIPVQTIIDNEAAR